MMFKLKPEEDEDSTTETNSGRPGALFEKYKADTAANQQNTTATATTCASTSTVSKPTTSIAAQSPTNLSTVSSTTVTMNNRPQQTTKVSPNIVAESVPKPTAQAQTSSASTSAAPRLTPVIVNRTRQEKNPILSLVRNVPYKFDDIVPDFEFGGGVCGLYLDLKYHRREPEYLEYRMGSIGHAYALQVLLVLVNLEDPKHLLRELNLCCLRAKWTLVIAYSKEEIAEYIELFKINENKSPEIFRQRASNRRERATRVPDLLPSVNRVADNRVALRSCIDFLCSITSINRRDAQTLIAEFGSLQRIAKAPVETLALVHGLGPLKAKRIYDAFRTPICSTTGAGVSRKTELVTGEPETEQDWESGDNDASS